MTKPTDEERREVAAKLRAKHRERNRPGVLVPQDAGMQVWDYLRDLEECLPDGDSAFTVLADLIEPEPERTCRIEHAYAKGSAWPHAACSECGGSLSYYDTVDEYGEDSADTCPYCPFCGSKVVE